MTPIEAAARAIYNADPQLGPDGPVPWDGQHTPLRAVCIAQARAAILAIRSPSDAMIEAAWDVAREESAAATWRAMIDTLLADP